MFSLANNEDYGLPRSGTLGPGKNGWKERGGMSPGFGDMDGDGPCVQ